MAGVKPRVLITGLMGPPKRHPPTHTLFLNVLCGNMWIRNMLILGLHPTSGREA